MADFEIRSAPSPDGDHEGVVTTSGVGFIDLDDLAPQLAPVVRELKNPEIEAAEPNRPPIAKPTDGPHRYTIIVPDQGEDATLHIGEGAPNRNHNKGITGRTLTHVHWHATQDAGATMTALGGPADAAESKNLHGIDGDTLAKNRGFMALTKGNVWLEAKQQWYGASETHDVTLRALAAGKRIVIQADQGELDLVAQKNLYAVSPGISIIAPAAVAPLTSIMYDAPWAGSQPKADSAKGTKNVITVMAAAVSAHDIVRKLVKSFKKSDEGKTKFSMGAWYDYVKWGADAAKFALTVPKIIDMFSKPEPKPGCVKINADADIGLLGGGEVSAFGSMGFSAGSAMWTSVSAGLSASFKALVFTGVGGAITSLKGYKKIEVASDYGEVIIKAAKDFNATAEKNAMIGAKKQAQLTSEGKTLVAANSKVVVGAGDGAGYGVVAQTNRIMVGKLDKSDEIDAKGNEAALIVVRDDSLRCVLKQSRLQLDEGEALLRAQAIKLSAESGGNVTVNGAKILLG